MHSLTRTNSSLYEVKRIWYSPSCIELTILTGPRAVFNNLQVPPNGWGNRIACLCQFARKSPFSCPTKMPTSGFVYLLLHLDGMNYKFLLEMKVSKVTLRVHPGLKIWIILSVNTATHMCGEKKMLLMVKIKWVLLWAPRSSKYRSHSFVQQLKHADNRLRSIAFCLSKRHRTLGWSASQNISDTCANQLTSCIKSEVKRFPLTLTEASKVRQIRGLTNSL